MCLSPPMDSEHLPSIVAPGAQWRHWTGPPVLPLAQWCCAQPSVLSEAERRALKVRSLWITVSQMQRPAFLNAWCLLKLAIWWLFCPAYFCRSLPAVLDLVPYSLAHSWLTGIPTQYLVLPWALQILSDSLEADPLLRLDSLGLGVLELAPLFSPMFSPLPWPQLRLTPVLPALPWPPFCLGVCPTHFLFLCFPPVPSSTIGFTADNQHLNVNYFIWPFVDREREIGFWKLLRWSKKKGKGQLLKKKWKDRGSRNCGHKRQFDNLSLTYLPSFPALVTLNLPSFALYYCSCAHLCSFISSFSYFLWLPILCQLYYRYLFYHGAQTEFSWNLVGKR